MTTPLKCVILDDEIPGLTYLKMLCEQIPELELVKTYNDPLKFVSDSASLDFDLCILDIEMPGMKGVQVAQSLRDKLIIFATAYRQYAADAFDLDAIDFVQKPVTKERLQVAVRKAIERGSNKSIAKRVVQLNTDKGKALIDISNVAYITTSEVDSRDKILVLLDQSATVLKNISFLSLHKQLDANEFCQVNKSQLIAMKIVSSFTFDEITTHLTQGSGFLKFSLSEAYRQRFQTLAKQLS